MISHANTNAASTGQRAWQLCGRDGVRFTQTRIKLMHRAQWQQDLIDDAELARRARTAETEAQGRIPCTTCGRVAQVFTRCDAMRFSSPQCDACGLERLQYAAVARASVSFDKLSGVDLPMTIEFSRPMAPAVPAPCDRCDEFAPEPDCTLCDGTGMIPDAFVKDDSPGTIDVAQLVVEVLDGAIHDRPVPAAPNAVQANALVIAVLESRLHRSLLPSERAAVERASTEEVIRRHQQRRADLRETQSALASPFRMFGQRAS